MQGTAKPGKRSCTLETFGPLLTALKSATSERAERARSRPRRIGERGFAATMMSIRAYGVPGLRGATSCRSISPSPTHAPEQRKGSNQASDLNGLLLVVFSTRGRVHRHDSAPTPNASVLLVNIWCSVWTATSSASYQASLDIGGTRCARRLAASVIAEKVEVDVCGPTCISRRTVPFHFASCGSAQRQQILLSDQSPRSLRCC